MTKLNDIYALGQSVWYDNIRRDLLDNGGLSSLIAQGVVGVTSNPTIFDKAIAGSADYDAQLRELAASGASTDAIYEALALQDIAHAADLLRPVYDRTGGGDGYISLEVSPTLAHNTFDTIKQARRLFATVGKPNVMIKVPATPEGIPAIHQLIRDGINVNITLIFSLACYDQVIEAYISGLEQRWADGHAVRGVGSVASFFVSRVDAALEKPLAAKGEQGAALQGKIAIANAKLAYTHFQERFSGPRWQALANADARVQRPLWASTGVKNPAWPDMLYVDALIGPDTVNTMPPATLDAALLRSTPARTIDANVAEARAQVAQLASLGISLEAVTQQLQDDGVASFANSFESLMRSIEMKRAQLMTTEMAEPHPNGMADHMTAMQQMMRTVGSSEVF